MAGEKMSLYDFVAEAREHLSTVAGDLLFLERATGQDADNRIDRVFRAVHSIKGAAGFFGCKRVEELAHALEAIFERLRRGEQRLDPALLDAILAGSDRIQVLLDDVEHSDEADIAELLQRLQAAPQAMPESTAAEVPTVELMPVAQPLAGPLVIEPLDAPPELLARRPPADLFVYRLSLDLQAHAADFGGSVLPFFRTLEQVGTLLDARLDAPVCDLSGPIPDGPLIYQAVCSSSLTPPAFQQQLGLDADELEVVHTTAPSAASATPAQAPVAAGTPPRPPAAVTEVALAPAAAAERSSSIRINVNLLDRLMNLAGELVLVRNQALQAIAPDDPHLRRIVQRLNSVTSELQEAVMLTRMQPVGNLFSRFPRMVRDLARQLGKEIELNIAGQEVELDKTILEALADPLTHLVRNCCDHGIEQPERRREQGKGSQGTVWLRAHHEAGQIRIEVRDDGRGLDVGALKRKALERAIKTEGELTRMTEKELFGLILLPGFSTAAAVTDVSGRGVGMDVVRTNIEQLGGNLEMESTAGRGTVFHLRLPLTLAIIPCLLVKVGGEQYAIPQKALEELVCVQADSYRDKIEYAYDQEVYRLRGRLLPLVRLDEVLKRRRPLDAADRAEILRRHRLKGPTTEGVPGLLSFAVVKVSGQRLGLVVDEILDSQEIVVKPMHGVLRSLSCYSGATIMGDGRVALIFDVEGIARHAGTFQETMALAPALPAPTDEEGETQTLLLFRSGPQEQLAVPLAMVRRVEMIQARSIERVGADEFITLAGVPTRIVRLDRYLAVSPFAEGKNLFLLLPERTRRPWGLLLSEVIDIDSRRVKLNTDSYRADGVLGSAIIRDQMTLFLDLARLVDMVDPPVVPAGRPALTGPMKRILLVDDTQFFREVVGSYLRGAGYDVEVADQGAAGLEKLYHQRFDLVVSDIEMPVMDGWTLARTIRQNEAWRQLPLLALTTLSSQGDRDRAAACGFNAYEVKLDRERFLGAVRELIGESRS